MTPPQFYDTNYESIKARLFERYEALSGRILLPAFAEALVLEVCAFEIKLFTEQSQAAATQMLLPFSNAPALDYLAELQGVARLASSSASVSLLYSTAVGHGGFTLPAGSRVASQNGQTTFLTDSDVVVVPGATTIAATATALNAGLNGNGFTPGQLTRLVDRRLGILSVTNASTSGGGADEETDEELRERIRLAGAGTSTAGPVKAYQFHARSASASIIDVAVTNPVAGTVNVYPLVQGGVVTPATVIQQVEAALDPETVVPLTDTVVVLSPTLVEVSVIAEFTMYVNADSTTALAAARLRIAEYLYARETRLGFDVNMAQLVGRAVGDATEVADVTIRINNTTADIELTPIQFAKTILLTTTVTGTTNG
jgi:phage-related baseplate assembly protein